MSDSEAVVVLVTTSSREEARKVTETLLDHRKVACVNIVPQVESRFWWQGKIDSAQECLLVIKTKRSVLEEVTDLVKTVHSYEAPEIIALPIVGGNPDYLKWIDQETQDV